MIDYYGIYKWNYLRNGCQIANAQLETDMFNEEYLEWRASMAQLLEVQFGEEVYKIFADIVDAFCDMEFVLQGSKAKGDFDARKDRILDYVYNTTISCLHKYNVRNAGVLVSQAQELVYEANCMKPISKTSGKVTKGNEWKDPKIEIMKLLEKYTK